VDVCANFAKCIQYEGTKWVIASIRSFFVRNRCKFEVASWRLVSKLASKRQSQHRSDVVAASLPFVVNIVEHQRHQVETASLLSRLIRYISPHPTVLQETPGA